MIKNSKLHNSFDYPYFSIIIDAGNSNLDDKLLLKFVTNLLNQTFRNIQIIILINSSSVHLNKNNDMITKNIEIYVSYKEKYINKICNSINRVKGKFLIILKEFSMFKNNEFYKIFNIIKKIPNHIYKYSINNNYLYLIRAKILRDIIDKGITFDNYEELIDIILSNIFYDPYSKINFIPISFCPNNKYAYLVYTSMISILCSKSYYTFINFFIVIPNDFTNQNIFLLESLYEQYDYFNITFIRMDNRYNNAFTTRYLTIQAYYRYSLGELITNLDKIIYLDGDTVCLTDLSDFYNLNFNGKIILGRPIKYEKNGKKEYFTINTGILLLNLREMRKIKFEKMLLNILNKGFGYKKIHQRKSDNPGTDILTQDQALINIYFNKYIGLFPPKYNVNEFFYKHLIKNNINLAYLYDTGYLYFSYKYPSIKHFPGPKKYSIHNEDWIYFAKKSKYFANNKYIFTTKI